MARNLYRMLAFMLATLALVQAPAAWAGPGFLDGGFSDGGWLEWSNGEDQLVAMARSPATGQMVVAGTGITDGIPYLTAARFNSDGSTDLGWGTLGTVKLPLLPIPAAIIRAVAVDSNGRSIFVGAAYTGINSAILVVALDSTGALDTSFGSGGIVTGNFGGVDTQGFAVTIDASDRILVAASTNEAPPSLITVVRLQPNGATDALFGLSGRSMPVFPGAIFAQPTAITLDTSARILVAGQCYDASFIMDSCFLRLLSGGLIDVSFNALGPNPGYKLVNAGLLGGVDRANAITVQPDGKIVAAGNEYDSVGVARGYVLRMTAAGALDPSFAGGTGIQNGFQNGTILRGVAVGADSRIFATGEIDYGVPDYWYSVLLSPSGNLDLSFNGTGDYVAGIAGRTFTGQALAASATNYFVAVREGNPGAYNFRVERFDATTLAGCCGFAYADALKVDSTNNAIAADGFGGYFTAGYADGGTGQRFVVSQVFADGNLNAMFGTAGHAWLPFGGVANGVAVDTSQRIVVVGNSSSNFMGIARVLQNGPLDTSFNGSGTLELLSAEATGLSSVEIQPDDKIVAAGFYTVSGSPFMAVIRLNPDGSLDTGFASGGIDILGIVPPGRAINAHVQPDGKIVVVGSSSSPTFPTLIRVTANGNYDPTFGSSGVLQVPIGITAGDSFASQLMPDGRIVVAGRVGFGGGTQAFVLRAMPNGVLDTTFNGTGFSFYSLGDGDSGATAIAVQSDGRILFGGYLFDTGVQKGFVARLLPNGNLDLSYNAGGVNSLAGFSRATTALIVGSGIAPSVSTHASTFLGNSGIAQLFGGTATGMDVAVTAPPTFPVGASAQVTITITNNSGFPITGLTFTSGPFGGALVNAVAPTSNCPGTPVAIIGGNTVGLTGTGGLLTAGSSCTIVIRVTSLVLTSGGISIADGAIAADTGFVSTGGTVVGISAIAAALPASIAASGGVGQSAMRGTTFAVPLSVTVRDASLLPVSGVQVTFSAPGVFFPTASLVTPTSLTDVNGVATTMAVAGNYYGTYTVTANVGGVATGASFTLTNLGSGVQPDTTQIAFGNRNINVTHTAPTVHIASVGNIALGSISISTTGAGFAASSSCTATLATGSSCPITITFTPTTEGNRTGQVVITSDAFVSPSVILLSGNGIDLTNPLGDADGDGVPNGVEASVNLNPLSKDNNVFGDARLFAMQQYRDFLGREGDAGGIAYYITLLNTGAATRANVVESFFNSPEFQGVGSPVARLYFATFLRIPDYPGLIFQINAFRAGTPLAVIANNFTLSPEFTQRYGAVNNAQFVGLLYQNILGRTPSQGEIDFHVNRLVSGATRGDVLVGFSESPEYQANTAHDVYVTMMYVGMLRRAPEQAGFDYWTNYMDAGSSGLALIAGFLQAPEYHNRFLP